MIHVDDLVRAMLFVADSQHTNSEVFIATDGRPYSSREIYNDMCHALGKSVPNWSVHKIFFDKHHSILVPEFIVLPLIIN